MEKVDDVDVGCDSGDEVAEAYGDEFGSDPDDLTAIFDPPVLILRVASRCSVTDFPLLLTLAFCAIDCCSGSSCKVLETDTARCFGGVSVGKSSSETAEFLSKPINKE